MLDAAVLGPALDVSADPGVSLSEPGSIGVNLEAIFNPVGEGELGLSDCRCPCEPVVAPGGGDRSPGGVRERFWGDATGMVMGVDPAAGGNGGGCDPVRLPNGPASSGEWRGVSGPCGPGGG